MDTDTHIAADESPAIQHYYAELAAQGNEGAIAHDIELMWSAHRAMQITVKDYRQELRLLGKTLGEALYYMKVLAKPGRNGKWSEFLLEKGISITSAERLVAAYERSLEPAPVAPVMLFNPAHILSTVSPSMPASGQTGEIATQS